MRVRSFLMQEASRWKAHSLASPHFKTLGGKVRIAALLFVAAACAVGAHAAPAETLTQLTPAGAHRPAGVPANFVITPFGYFDPACVRTLASGEHVRKDGKVQHADGSVEATAVSCSQPHFLKSGIRIDPAHAGAVSGAMKTKAGKIDPTINGWIESASVTTGTESASYGALTAYFTVPRNPTSDVGQTVYLFPGFEDINNVQSILQPVLGYNSGRWTIASWNCCINGVTTNSSPVQVNPGDSIYGSVLPNCGAGTLSCGTWNVDTQDVNTGGDTALNNTPSEGQVFNWAFGGVLEVYGINTCDNLPPDDQSTYDRINLYDQNDNLIGSPQWGTSVSTTATPSCNYQVNTTPQTVTVVY